MQLSFIPDGMDVLHLPVWVKNSKQTTDGHLLQLAGANDAVLATLDENSWRLSDSGGREQWTVSSCQFGFPGPESGLKATARSSQKRGRWMIA